MEKAAQAKSCCGREASIAESFVAMMGRIQDQLELQLDTQVADFHFKPIEIYHKGGDQTKVVIIINTMEAKGRFYVVVMRVQLVGRSDGWSTFTSAPFFAPPLSSFSQVGFHILSLALVRIVTSIHSTLSSSIPAKAVSIFSKHDYP